MGNAFGVSPASPSQQAAAAFTRIKESGAPMAKDDFIHFIVSQRLGLTEADAAKMFAHADTNGDGNLRDKELAIAIHAAKDTAMTVPVRIIVPSTTNVSGSIDEQEMKSRVDQVIEMLCKLFGGATASAPQRGAYVSESGQIVHEEVVSVTSFCTPELWKEHCAQVRLEVADLCKKWGQECMGMEFAGFLEYIYATEPSAEQLWASVIPRLHKRAIAVGKLF